MLVRRRKPVCSDGYYAGKSCRSLSAVVAMPPDVRVLHIMFAKAHENVARRRERVIRAVSIS